MAKHAWSGSCAPGKGAYSHWNTFSVGIYEVVPKAGGKGTKHGKVKVRVSGPFSDPESVDKKASEIAAQLDAGTYNGPKRVTVK